MKGLDTCIAYTLGPLFAWTGALVIFAVQFITLDWQTSNPHTPTAWETPSDLAWRRLMIGTASALITSAQGILSAFLVSALAVWRRGAGCKDMPRTFSDGSVSTVDAQTCAADRGCYIAGTQKAAEITQADTFLANVVRVQRHVRLRAARSAATSRTRCWRQSASAAAHAA